MKPPEASHVQHVDSAWPEIDEILPGIYDYKIRRFYASRETPFYSPYRPELASQAGVVQTPLVFGLFRPWNTASIKDFF